MKIGFIGAGKVGFSLGKHFIKNSLNVTGYYSLHPDSSKEAAEFTNSQPCNSLNDIISANDILFLTVPDGCISEVYELMLQSDLAGKCIAHCSGALSSDVFYNIENKGATACSVHPLCAVSSKLTGHRDLAHAYFTLEGTGAGLAADLLKACGNTFEIISAENKIKYHAAAVFASNLVIGLYETATNLLRECGLSEDFSKNALKSLFTGNADNLINNGSIHALTGPVERADTQTVLKHLASLTGSEKEIYRLLSTELINIAKIKNPDRSYEELLNILT